jgi:hypothetical protein
MLDNNFESLSCINNETGERVWITLYLATLSITEKHDKYGMNIFHSIKGASGYIQT